MRKMFSIPMPRRLCTGVFYNRTSKEYCAVGYLLRHICKVSTEECRHGGGESRLAEFLPGFNELREKMVDGNNAARTQKARIASFKKFCGMLGIKLT